MIDDIDHVYVFIKSFVVVLEILKPVAIYLKVFPSSSCIVIAPYDETLTMQYGHNHLLRSFP